MTFPKTSVKKETFGRSFQPKWFNDFNWLHYHETEDAVYCFTCLKAIENNALSELSLNQSDAFTKSGYRNWKKALQKNKGFNKHQNSRAHKEATARFVTQKPSDTKSVDHLINSANNAQMAENRRMFLKILSNVRFLGKSSLFFFSLLTIWEYNYNLGHNILATFIVPLKMSRLQANLPRTC